MQNQRQMSVWNKGFTWLANHTYRQIPAVIASYSIKNSQPKSLSFQDYISSPELAREAGLMCVRQMKMDFIKRKQGIQKVINEFKSRKNLQSQKPHEFQCPICLEMINGPVTTSCSHTFCHMCLDEAILFNSACPVCRNQIRGDQLIVSKSIERLISMFLAKIELQEVEKYVQKELDYENWVKRRTIKKEDIDIGDCIDVRDTEFIWCRATIKDIFPVDCESKNDREAILVHYEGWANVFNEIIPLDSQRLAQFKFYTCRVQIPHYNLNNENNEHLRSPVIIGQYIPPPVDLQDSGSFEFVEDSYDNDNEMMRINPIVRSFSPGQSDLSNYLLNSDELVLHDNQEVNPFHHVILREDIFRRSNHLNRNSRNFNPFERNNDRAERRNNSFLFEDFQTQNYYRQRNQQLLERQNRNFQESNQSIRPASQQGQRENNNRSYENMLNRSVPQHFISSPIVFCPSNIRGPNRNQNYSNASSLDDIGVTPVYNFVDSLELYSRNDQSLRNRLQMNSHIHRPALSNLSDSISLHTDSSNQIQNFSIDYDNLSVKTPGFSFRQTDQLDHSQSKHIYEQKTHRNRLMQLYFKQSQDPNDLPFLIDIEAIQSNNNEIAQQIKNLQRDHKEMQEKIQEKEKSRKLDIQKLNRLNKYINQLNYYNQTQNPQGQFNNDNILQYDCFDEHLQLYQFQNKNINQNYISPSLETVLSQIIEFDHQNQGENQGENQFDDQWEDQLKNLLEKLQNQENQQQNQEHSFKLQQE